MKSSDYSKNKNSTAVTRTVIIVVWVLIAALTALAAFLFASTAAEMEAQKRIQGESNAPEFSPRLLICFFDDNYSETPIQILLLDFNSKEGKIGVTGLPVNLKATVYNKTMTLAKHFEYGGTAQLKPAVEQMYDIEIDRYIGCPFSKVEELVDKLGGVHFVIDGDMKYTNRSGAVVTNLVGGEQTLNGHQTVMFLRYGGFKTPAVTAQKREQLAIRAINQYSSEDILTKIVGLFDSTADMLDTDVSKIDATDMQNEYAAFIKGEPAVRAEVGD